MEPVCVRAGLLWHTLPVTFAGSFARAAGDPGATRVVYAIVAALALIGVALVFLAVWVIKQTRPEPELLAPLERMSDRAWRKQDPAQKRRALDEVRPPGAEPVTREPDPPERDDEFDQRVPAIARFDDLVDRPDVDPASDAVAEDVVERLDGDELTDDDEVAEANRAADGDAGVANTADADEIAADEVAEDEAQVEQ